jgi:gas vesicle protein
MSSYNPEDRSDAMYLWTFLIGLLAGSLVGAGAMLLLAPQSGRKTRSQIQQKSTDLREQTADTVESSLKQARRTSGKIRDDVFEKTDELEHRAQDAFGEGSERVSSAVKAGKKALHDLQR